MNIPDDNQGFLHKGIHEMNSFSKVILTIRHISCHVNWVLSVIFENFFFDLAAKVNLSTLLEF